MILDSDNNLLELRSYDGEFAGTEWSVYLAAVDAWLSSFRIARKHDTIPVVYSTTQKQYFEDQLNRHKFKIENGMIPTPIISFWMNGWNIKQGFDKPKYTKYYNRKDGAKYPDLIPCDAMYTISIWTYKREDMFEITQKIRTAFDTGIFWIKFTDPTTGMTQHTPFFWESMTDASNLEPGPTDNTLIRRDINLRSEHYLPRAGEDVPLITKVYLDFRTDQGEQGATIDYISGSFAIRKTKVNDGALTGRIAPGHVYASGIVNAGQNDEEYVKEDWSITVMQGLH